MLIVSFFVDIKNDLVSSWDGMSQLSEIHTVMFVVNLKKAKWSSEKKKVGLLHREL